MERTRVTQVSVWYTSPDGMMKADNIIYSFLHALGAQKMM